MCFLTETPPRPRREPTGRTCTRRACSPARRGQAVSEQTVANPGPAAPRRTGRGAEGLSAAGAVCPPRSERAVVGGSGRHCWRFPSGAGAGAQPRWLDGGWQGLSQERVTTEAPCRLPAVTLAVATSTELPTPSGPCLEPLCGGRPGPSHTKPARERGQFGLRRKAEFQTGRGAVSLLKRDQKVTDPAKMPPRVPTCP